MKHYKSINKSYLNDAGHEQRHNKNEYIVIHYTAGANDTAEAVAQYFRNIWKSKSRYASAHFVVDDKSVFKCVDTSFTAWHCGGDKYKYSNGGKLYGKCSNYNSIGIEMCKQLNTLDYLTLENTIALCKDLVKKYGIPTKNIVRHYDVTGKHCPAKMIDDNEAYKNNWSIFKKAIATGDKFYITIDKNGNCYKRERHGNNNLIKIGQFKS